MRFWNKFFTDLRGSRVCVTWHLFSMFFLFFLFLNPDDVNQRCAMTATWIELFYLFIFHSQGSALLMLPSAGRTCLAWRRDNCLRFYFQPSFYSSEPSKISFEPISNVRAIHFSRCRSSSEWQMNLSGPELKGVIGVHLALLPASERNLPPCFFGLPFFSTPPSRTLTENPSIT